MRKEDKTILCVKAVANYGREHQMDKAVEELGELLTEVARYKQDVGRKNALVGEMADVTIMLEQLKIIAGISDEYLEDVISYKLGRLAGHMEAEEGFDDVDDAL